MAAQPGESAPKQIVGTVFNVQRYSIHDGPGIRTIVFMKGCPLRCKWCSNPESQQTGPEVAYMASRCVACRGCVGACPSGALSFTGDTLGVDRRLCDACGACVRACPAGALELFGRRMTVEEVMDRVRRDAPFYSEGGGGLTISGGEPFWQPRFTSELLRAAKGEGLSTTVETAGHVKWEAIAPALNHLDLVLYDVKHVDPSKHREGTGVSNELVLSNLRRLAESRARFRIRVPLIPGFNADPESLRQIAEFTSGAGALEVDLLPYHALGSSKYRVLGREYPWAGVKQLSDEEVEKARGVFERAGLKAGIGG